LAMRLAPRRRFYPDRRMHEYPGECRGPLNLDKTLIKFNNLLFIFIFIVLQ
jgi:hypothetical protein